MSTVVVLLSEVLLAFGFYLQRRSQHGVPLQEEAHSGQGEEVQV
jgi:hypothetical protein